MIHVGQIVGSPLLYDCAQVLAGSPYVYRRAREFWPAGVGRMLDVGAGTGRGLALAGSGARWVGIDIKRRKLDRLKQRHPGRVVVQADATTLPMQTQSCDSAVCVFVTHHLTDDQLRALCAELARVVRGSVLIVDALAVPGRRLSRWMWRIDRGAYPRQREHILALLAESFRIVRTAELVLAHRYLFCDCVPALIGGRAL